MYHKITVAGNLGRDPEMRYLPNGDAVTSFSVAVTDGFGENKTTIWFRVSIFGKRAETANQYLSKGSKILVEGRLRADKKTGGPTMWTGRDGTVNASFEITATDFAFLSSARDSSSGGGSSGHEESGFGSSANEEDDIPF